MKIQKLCALLSFVLILTAPHLHAQITDIEQFKILTYFQSNSTPPTVLESAFFGNRLYSDPNFDISLPMVFTSSTNGFEFLMDESDVDYYTYSGPSYPTKQAFDADYPNGQFTYVVTYQDTNLNNFADNVHLVTSSVDLYTTNLPAFTSECWTAMQNVDPGKPFTLSWNSYNVTPGADFAHTFIGSYDNTTFDSTYGSFNFDCDPPQTSVTIPAGTLSYGRSYSFLLYFSVRQDPVLTNEIGGTLTTIIGFDNQTHANLITIPLKLTIALTNNSSIVLAWPASATNFVLQTTAALPATADDWNEVFDIPTSDGINNTLIESAADVSAFYRLAPITP